VLTLYGAAATDAFAQRFARQFLSEVVERGWLSEFTPVWIWLSGPLGAGKSSFARALMRALGVTGSIKSPTYTLVETYDVAHPDPAHGQALQIVHADLYRLGSPSELHALGMDELLSGCALALIEWPERGAGWLPHPHAHLTLQHSEDGLARTATWSVQAGSAFDFV
jgi:tRNA threonylcarbamoyladenosine biosynthesis protein TsaE